MRRAWTVMDDAGEERTDIAVVVAETKEDALEALRKEMQDGNEYSTFVVIDDSIYEFAPGYGYKCEEWNCEDLRPDMWDESEADRTWDVSELPCYYMGEEYDADDFFKYHDLISPMNRNDFKRKFSRTQNYNFVLMDESISDIAEYLSNGTVLLHSDWNGEYYCPDEKHYYYPVDIPISYYYDDDDEKMEPDQYETVGYILETY